MPFVQLTFNNRRPIDIGSTKGKAALRKVANFLQGAIAGTRTVDGWQLLNDNTPQSGTTAAGAACRAGAVGLFATGTGTETCIINGTSVAVTWATSDANSVSLMVAAILANTTVNPFVAATKYVGKVTLATVLAGETIDICGYKFTGTAAATGSPGEFSIATDDAAASTALALAINSTPGLSSKVVAVPDGTDSVYIGIADNRAARPDEVILKGAATFTVVQIAATGAYYMVFARQPGKLGNCCTLTVSGTNHSAKSAVSGKLGGGLGGYLSTSQYISSDSK